MGRAVLLPVEVQFSTTHHQALAILLAVAWMATAMTVFLSFCATCNRKPSGKASSPPTSTPRSESDVKSASAETGENKPPQEAHVETHTVAAAAATESKDTEVTVFPVEAAATHGPNPPTVLPKSTSSKGKLSLSFGRGLSEKLRTSRKERKGEGEVTVIPVEAAATHGPIPPTVLPTSTSSKRKMSLSFGKGLSEKLRTSRKERKGEGEDMVWKKTIILGEKCKVSSDDDDEEVVVDEKGNRQRYYHPKTPKSRHTSRKNSLFANPDEAPHWS